MRAANAVLSLAIFLGTPAAGEPADPCGEARLVSIRGGVTVYTRRGPAGTPAKEGQALKPGDRLKTDQRSYAEVSLGGGGLLYAGAETDFSLAGPKGRGEFTLVKGTLLLKSPTAAPFSGDCLIRTPSAVATGRAAEFGVVVPPRDRLLTRVGVFDAGWVEVRGKRGAPQRVAAGHETTVLAGGGPWAVSKLNNFALEHRLMRWMRRRLKNAARTGPDLSARQHRPAARALLSAAR